MRLGWCVGWVLPQRYRPSWKHVAYAFSPVKHTVQLNSFILGLVAVNLAWRAAPRRGYVLN